MITRITKPDRVVDTRMNFLIDEIEAEIGKYSNFDLYLKSGGAASATKPTGSGTLVNFSNLTTTEQLAFEFNYTLPSQVVISKDNRYFFNLPFKGLETNRGYIFRAVLMVGTNQLVNHTEPAFTPTSTDFTVKFEKINEQVVDLTIPAGQIVNLKIYVKLASGTDTLISMLVNDISDSARVSRNELVTEGVDKVGDLTTLTTTNKTNAVNAINEVNSKTNQLSNPNLLINGDFQVWQRGTGFANLTNLYGADRWKIGNVANVNQSAVVPDIRYKYSCRVHKAPTWSNKLYFAQYTEANNGSSMTLSFWAKVDVGETLEYTISYGGTSYTLQGTGSWVFVSKTFTPTTGLAGVEMNMLPTADGKGFNITGVKLELGEIATPFSPRSYAEELAMCQRYYEKSWNTDGACPATSNLGKVHMITPSNTISNGQTYGKVPYSVTKRANATVIIRPYSNPNNTFRVSNSSGVDLAENTGNVTGNGITGFSVYNNNTTSPTTTLNTVAFHWEADAEIY